MIKKITYLRMIYNDKMGEYYWNKSKTINDPNWKRYVKYLLKYVELERKYFKEVFK